MTPPQRLLEYLEAHHSITRLESVTELGIQNLWARIADLEREPYCCSIRHEDQVAVINRFGQKCHVTRYHLLTDRYAIG
jgi:hypothetical protein